MTEHTRSYHGPRPALSDEDARRFADLIASRSGLQIPASRRRDLELAVAGRLEEMNLPDTDALYGALTDGQGDRVDIEALVASMTVDESHFFRHQGHFDALEGHVVPEITARRGRAVRLRVWSAGCASGQEAYTLAIVLRRSLPPSWTSLILATDISHAALDRARRGAYGPWSFREVTPDSLAPDVERMDDRRFVVSDGIRAMVSFGYLNLGEDVYPSLVTDTVAMDVIFCRNVLLYFDRDTVTRVVGRLRDCLAPGGYLVVSPSELSLVRGAGLEPTSIGGATLFRKPVGQSAAAAPVDDVAARRKGPAPPWRGAETLPESSGRTGPNDRVRAAPRERRERDAVASVTRERDPAAPVPGRGGSANEAFDRDLERERAIEQLRTGEETTAVDTLVRLAESDPSDARPAHALARHYADRQNLDEARGWTVRALTCDPLHAPSHYLSGLLHLEVGELDDALGALRRAIYADPGFVVGRYALASVFARAGQSNRARKELENVSELLAGRASDEPLPEGEGLTAGRLREIAAVHEGLLS